MDIDNGGPAFPGVTVNDTDGNLLDPFGTLLPPQSQASYSGMTLRDYFAAKALVGLLAEAANPRYGREVEPFMAKHVEPTAVQAYDLADAMLKARSQ